jgi:hypothetical protein
MSFDHSATMGPGHEHSESLGAGHEHGEAAAVPILATGATAGTPGYFTPEGAEPLPDLAAMQATTGATLMPEPTTNWPPGTYVVLGDASECYWASEWIAGQAAADEESHARHTRKSHEP